MTPFFYNDTPFTLQANGDAWDITRTLPDGSTAFLGCRLFAGLSAPEAEAQAQALVRQTCPVGVKVVGPDVSRPNAVNGMKIIGPNVSHPNFVRWVSDSTSFPRDAGTLTSTPRAHHAD